ncbi:hypothetical protein [Phormidium sp. CCY1219]|uniref:hypothetical protein n=1 Tax=Phormidium sp. CCY1219 TaxID=2886104 RepID=UPI002D1F31C5|nr:hypothetical protein [Phormidium sp. CCY1219]MEB3829001.1 hypothetical protein [Phormidium sp. CCY1219]
MAHNNSGDELPFSYSLILQRVSEVTGWPIYSFQIVEFEKQAYSCNGRFLPTFPDRIIWHFSGSITCRVGNSLPTLAVG